MSSESVIMSSAAEARFRVQAPNSTPRAVTVIALDARSEPVVRRLADHNWNRASFLVSNGTLCDLAGQAANLDAAVAAADLIVMVAAAGGTVIVCVWAPPSDQFRNGESLAVVLAVARRFSES